MTWIIINLLNDLMLSYSMFTDWKTVNNESSDRFIEQDFNLRWNFYCLPNFPISLLNKEAQGSSGPNIMRLGCLLFKQLPP